MLEHPVAAIVAINVAMIGALRIMIRRGRL
jgi:hypothetical protein